MSPQPLQKFERKRLKKKLKEKKKLEIYEMDAVEPKTSISKEMLNIWSIQYMISKVKANKVKGRETLK